MSLNRIRSRSILIISLVLVSLIMLSCRSLRKSGYSPSYVSDKTNEELFSDVLDNMLTYDKMEARVSLSISMGNSSLESKGVLRIVKDSLVQLSVQPLFGLEMFKFHMDKDSLFIIDRMNKVYVKELLSDVRKKYPITPDLYSVQALFSNRMFVLGKKGIDKSDFRNFRISNGQEKYLIDNKDVDSSLNYSFLIDRNDYVTRTSLTKERSSLAMSWQYDNFEKFLGATFPFRIKILAHGRNEKMSTEIVYDKIDLNKDFKTKMSISSKFRKIGLTDLMDIIPEHR